jgi:hypothetical protein
MTPDTPPTYQVTIRVSVLDVDRGAKLGPDAVSSFDVHERPDLARIGEAAVEGARIAATSLLVPGAIGVRAARAVRELARRPEVERLTAIAAALARQAATTLEDGRARAAARIVHEQHPTDSDT